MNAPSWDLRLNWRGSWRFLLLFTSLFFMPQFVFAQQDQGAITGIVTDGKDAVVPNATVTLTNTGTNLVQKRQTDASGNYTFQPIKVGTYNISVSAPNFQTTTLTGLEVHVASRLQANIKLKVGNITETMEVSASTGPLLQTEESSTGQVISTDTINDMPLTGRNFVFAAQEAAGIPASNGSRGQGNGDFTANGMRATQNNFILDGVDNNSSSTDILNGASYVVKPPPDALQEFKVQTSSFSAEFGHSAGAVVNVSLKSGTNAFRGNAWEYVRNNALGQATPTEWASGVTHPTTVPPYHQNQFGFTFGGPIIKSKLFFFGDYEGVRIAYKTPMTMNVPTALMRTGDFTELLNPNLTGSASPYVLYEPGTAGHAILGSSCGYGQNKMCPGQINSIASKLINLYPQPNTNDGKTYNNYVKQIGYKDNTNSFDVRIDYNLSEKDQMFGRVTRAHEDKVIENPLGDILDGSRGFGGTYINYGDNMMFSENHIFSASLINQVRASYNWGYFSYIQANANVDISSQYGLGGIPYQLGNGGLPHMTISGANTIGTGLFMPSPEHQNVYQLIDDLTWIRGRHSLKFGASFQNTRYNILQPTYGRTAPGYDGHFTASPGVSYTGWGVADFLADYMSTDYSSSYLKHNMGRNYLAGYFQDSWKLSRKTTFNWGVRYEFFTQPVERNDQQANLITIGAINAPKTGKAKFVLPESQRNLTLNSAFLAQAAKDNISIEYSDNRALTNTQKKNFAPRLGLSYQVNNRLVARVGAGLFYGGIESLGGTVNLGNNFPYDLELSWTAPSCKSGATSCSTNGATLKNGPPSGGFNPYGLGLGGADETATTPYAISYNLATEYAFTNTTSLTLAYVGSIARHLPVVVYNNSSAAIAPNGTNTMSLQPFPDFGSFHSQAAAAVSSYNSLQATLQHHYSNGISYTTTYTWSHSLDDAREPLPSSGEGGDKNYNMFGLGVDYADSPFDVRQRFTFVGNYDLPFGVGRKYLNKHGALNLVTGGWSASLMFNAQQGQPFTVSPRGAINQTTNAVVGKIAGATTFASKSGDPWKAGGAAPSGNPGITCASSTRNVKNWYNPCAFSNPLYPTDAAWGNNGYITGMAALPYTGGRRGQITGPGYERINMTAFKNFQAGGEGRYFQFRADVFNLFNTPAKGMPSNTSIDGSASGQITSTRTMSANSPDPRFFQLALKFYF